MSQPRSSEALYNRVALGILVLAVLIVVGVLLVIVTPDASGEDAAPPTPTQIVVAVPDRESPVLPPSWTPEMRPINSATPTWTATPGHTPTAIVLSSTPTNAPSATPTRLPSPVPTSLPPVAPLDNIPLGLAVEVEGLAQPTGLADAGDSPGRLYVLEKRGTIRIVQNGTLLSTPFLDLTSKVSRHETEDGLLGLAFHPNYDSNGTFYVSYTSKADQSLLVRYTVSSNPDLADASSETVLLSVGQPTPEHNAGNLAFGPDGYLYMSLGDGGGVGDEFNNAQNGSTLLGGILRLDVAPAGGSTYGIPPGNPFVGDSNVRDEIWAYGLRNPWGISFDRQTRELYIMDTGEVAYEEINVQPAGAGGQNYGWPLAQGRHCYPNKADICDVPGTTPPALEVPHTPDICALVGGYVYRGQDWPVLRGTYLYADFCSGKIFALRRSTAGAWQSAEVFPSGLNISAFGEDRFGELYIMDFRDGVLYRVVAGLA